MNGSTVLALAKANLDFYANYIGFDVDSVGVPHEDEDGLWYVDGSIYKGQYSICVVPTAWGFVVVLRDLSVK